MKVERKLEIDEKKFLNNHYKNGESINETMKKQKSIQSNIKRHRSNLENSYIAVILFLTFFIFTFIGAGNFIVVSSVGVFLCIIGILQSSLRVDLWVLLPLIFYNVFSLISGYRIYGNTLEGFASIQSIFPIIYLLVACLDSKERTLLKRMCAIWVGIIAFIGIGQFIIASFSGTADRLSGLIGNPNAMGAIQILGWFSLHSCLNEVEEDLMFKRFLQSLEFIVLVALVLTLSFCSFGALFIGVITMHIYGKEKFSVFMIRIGRIIFACGCGTLLYLAGDTANSPWLCLVLFIYILAVAINWYEMKRYFNNNKWIIVVICLVGICSVGILFFLRPNATATFIERLYMIRNGLGYLGRNPFFGVGPYQWRWINLYDADPYFNTWHIHNVFVHVGVELGLCALLMLIIVLIRHICKKEELAQRGMFFALLLHNLVDTSFFYIATVPFLIMNKTTDDKKTHFLNEMIVKCIFGVFAIFFAWNLFQCLRG